jgi:hypothetical protein
MANLRPERTGLPFVVFISQKAGARHDVRVKAAPLQGLPRTRSLEFADCDRQAMAMVLPKYTSSQIRCHRLQPTSPNEQCLAQFPPCFCAEPKSLKNADLSATSRMPIAEEILPDLLLIDYGAMWIRQSGHS